MNKLNELNIIGANTGVYAAVNDTAEKKLPLMIENIIRSAIIPNKDTLKYMLSA